MPNFSHDDDDVQRILQEEDLLRNRGDQGVIPSSTALVSQAKTRARHMCSHCKRVSRLADFCIQPGGKMEGRSLEGPEAAQRAASQRSSRAGHSTQSPASVPPMINGVSYTPGSNNTDYCSCDSLILTPSTGAPLCFMTSEGAPIVDGDYDFSYIAMCGGPQAPVDWWEHSGSADLNQFPAEPVAYSSRIRIPINW